MTDVTDIRDKCHIDDDAVLRWNSNAAVPFDDMLQVAVDAGIIFNIPASQTAREEESIAAMRRYTESRSNMSDEQRREEAMERRAAFGPGEVVVNIITGERWKT